ncbi:MaoC family dehydratase [Phreatobacter oligotrophus]|uniref:MaoC family dehydratase n=1 Tax=Phreatobacter oligotrophus TaxID=1122261 RepID=UPI0023554277|nr:MaoC family dehydratase [Phreatobacter oligotrophus]MBX9990805.1 MaoC family dehydratase [Phreatobacter oligotrophus]
MPGLYFDDFSVGRHFAHEVTRTITEADNIWFSCLTLNPQPLHIDAHAAARSEYGRPIVNSLFTLGLLVGLTVADTTLNTTVANLGFTEVKFPAPVFPGDSIRAETWVREVRRSRSRPEQGIVTFEHKAFNQNGVEVASCLRAALMRCRPAA